MKNKHKISYNKYIKSDQRNYLKITIFEEYNNKCECCNKIFLNNNLVLHHKHYGNFKNETKEDLLVLCKICHNLIHFNNGKRIKTSKKFLQKSFERIKAGFN